MENNRINKLLVATFWVAIAMSLLSCEQVIDLELDAPPRKLVVEARIEIPKTGMQTQQVVKLTTIGDFFVN